MIKYVFLALFSLAMMTFVFYQKSQPLTGAEKHREWRRTATEQEFSARPEYFDQMKLSHGADLTK